MNKYTIILSTFLAFAFASCTQEDFVSQNSKAEITNLSFSLPIKELQTKAAAKEPAMHADLKDMRLYLYVFRDGELVSKIEKEVEDFSEPQNVELRLLTGLSYKVVAWADYGSKYYSVDSTMVTLTDVNDKTSELDRNGNDTKNDAFFVSTEFRHVKGANVDMVLRRPFGLVQVVTNDWNEAAVRFSKPDNYYTYIDVPTKFDLLTGAVSEVKKVKFAGVITPEADDSKKLSEKKLSFDYIFAAPDITRLKNFRMQYSKGKSYVCKYDFNNIPVKRNFVTNIFGSVLTKKGDVVISIDQNLNISIDQDWNKPNIDVDADSNQ